MNRVLGTVQLYPYPACMSILDKEHLLGSYGPWDLVLYLLTMAPRSWPETHLSAGSSNFGCYTLLPFYSSVCWLTQHTSWLSAPHLLRCQLKGQHSPWIFCNLGLQHQFFIFLANTYSQFYLLDVNCSLYKIIMHSKNVLSIYYLPNNSRGWLFTVVNKVICEIFKFRHKDCHRLEKPTANQIANTGLGKGRSGWHVPAPA